MTKRLVGATAALLVIMVAAVMFLRAAPAQSGTDATMRDVWLTVEGKPGALKTLDGRVIFTHAANGPNGPHVVESVGRDHVTIASSTVGTKNIWRYTIPLERVELHIFR